MVVIIQLAILPFLCLLHRLCILLPVFSFIHITNILTFYLNTSLWMWTIYMITASASCGTGLENPLFTYALILVCFLLACSLIDCFLSREGKAVIFVIIRMYFCSGWYLLDLKTMADAAKYFGKWSYTWIVSFSVSISEKLRSSPPVARVNIECFHTNTVSALGLRGGIFTRSVQVE